MSIKRHLRIIFILLKMKLSKSMVFRFSFFGVSMVDGSLFLMQLLMFTSIYSKVETIGNWNRSQMILFIGTFTIIDALNMAVFFFGLITIPSKIKSGELDLYITKPVNTLFHLTFESMDPGSVPMVLAGIGLLYYGVSGMGIYVTPLMIIGYIFLVVLMLILYYDMALIIRTIPFFVIQATSLERLEGEFIVLCMKIPGTLFKGAFKVLFYLVLPYGIMATVPTQFFSKTLTPAGFCYSIAIVAVFTVFALRFWKFGLKNYKSASS